MALPKGESVVVPGREVTDIQGDPSERLHLHGLSLGQKPIGDSPLIEHLDRARLQASGSSAVEHLVRTPFDDHHLGTCDRQFGRQHHPRRTATGDHYRMPSHTTPLIRLFIGAGDSAHRSGRCCKDPVSAKLMVMEGNRLPVRSAVRPAFSSARRYVTHVTPCVDLICRDSGGSGGSAATGPRIFRSGDQFRPVDRPIRPDPLP